MARSGVKDGKIVLVSSLLGLMGLVGYSQYAPMKYAIRGTFAVGAYKRRVLTVAPQQV